MTMAIWRDSTEPCKKNVYLEYHRHLELTGKRFLNISTTTILKDYILALTIKHPYNASKLLVRIHRGGKQKPP